MRKLLILLLFPFVSFGQFGIPVSPCSEPVVGTVFSSTLQESSIADYGRDGSELIQLGNYVYLIGGWNAGSTPTENNEVYKAHISDLTTWTKLANAPWAVRHTFGCGLIGRTLFIWGAGGNSANGTVHDCWSATADVNGDLTWTLRCANLPYSWRYLYGTTVHNNYLYTIGGESYAQTSSDGSIKDVWRSADGVTWTQIGTGVNDFNINLSGTTVSAWGKIYVCGGGFYPIYGGGSTVSGAKVWVSTDDGVSWTQLSDMPVATFYPKTIFFNNKIISAYGLHNNPPAVGTELQYMTQAGSWVQPTITSHIDLRHATSVAKIVLSNCTQRLGIAVGTNNQGASFAANDFYTVTITP